MKRYTYDHETATVIAVECASSEEFSKDDRGHMQTACSHFDSEADCWLERIRVSNSQLRRATRDLADARDGLAKALAK